MTSPRRVLKRILWTVLTLFLLMNGIACLHAWKFTHYAEATGSKTPDAHKLSWSQKIKTLFLGIDNPRPENKRVPDGPFETVELKSNKRIVGWLIKADMPVGTVILFHGYGGEKSSLLDKAEQFRIMGYNTLLIDFMGSGGSEGNQTTIGFKEAEEVNTACLFMSGRGEKNITLFGTSMGAVAIMKALSDYKLDVKSIILECPFGTLLQTVEARFRTMHVPSFPMAQLLVFWGGSLNGFNGFSHNPVDYAGKIHCPTLLLYGEKDEKVSRGEIDEIYKNLAGTKELKTFPQAGHENYLAHYKKDWTAYISAFLKIIPGADK